MYLETQVWTGQIKYTYKLSYVKKPLIPFRGLFGVLGGLLVVFDPTY